jgi:transposase
MRSRTTFCGPAAPGLTEDGVPTASDFLDIFDERIWRTRLVDDPYEAQYAAIAAVIACCGADAREIADLRAADLSLRRSGEKSRETDTIWIGRGDARRQAWIPDVAAPLLKRLTGQIVPAPGCDRLFMRRDGTPLNRRVIACVFEQLCLRIGIGCGLHVRLRTIFQAHMDETGDVHAAAFLNRDVAKMRSARAAGGIGEPSLAQLRKAFKKSSHPLRTLTRAMLHHVGPLQRARPSADFQALSREAQIDIKAARSNRWKYAYPPELFQAVLAALAAGRNPREIARHYGIPEATVDSWRYRHVIGGIPLKGASIRQRTHRDAFFAHVRRNPNKTLAEYSEWLERERGVLVSIPALRTIDWKTEVGRSRLFQGPLNNQRNRTRLVAHVRAHPEATVHDVRRWVREVLGLEMSLQGLWTFASRRELKFATPKRSVKNLNPPKIANHDKAVAAYVIAHPDATIGDLLAWVRDTFGFSVHECTLYRLLRRQGLKAKVNRRRWPNRR